LKKQSKKVIDVHAKAWRKGERTMPENHGKAGEKKGDWLKIELSAPGELIDALTNFVTEIGAQGAFQTVHAFLHLHCQE